MKNQWKRNTSSKPKLVAKPVDTIQITFAHVDIAQQKRRRETYNACVECILAVAAQKKFGRTFLVSGISLWAESEPYKVYFLDHKGIGIVHKFDTKQPIQPTIINLYDRRPYEHEDIKPSDPTQEITG